MAHKQFKPLDFAKVRTYPVTKRFSKVQTSLLGKRLKKGASLGAFIRGLPDILAAENLKTIAAKIADATARTEPFCWGWALIRSKSG
jgi:hypothetical protein